MPSHQRDNLCFGFVGAGRYLSWKAKRIYYGQTLDFRPDPKRCDARVPLSQPPPNHGRACRGRTCRLTAPAARAETLEPTSLKAITTYNNFYEFGTGKEDPVKYGDRLTTDPWTIEIDGMVDRPGAYALGDILSKMTIEERIYRFRCVEAWSMVVPWNGFELADLLDMAGVQSGRNMSPSKRSAPEEMPVRDPVLDWPMSRSALDEAMHPLTLMATGIYGKPIPNQNGAPIRLVVPWKYGFKSIKSIVRITLTDREPPTSWNKANASEYGFYSNVNPKVDHPRWSQATERPIGGGFFAARSRRSCSMAMRKRSPRFIPAWTLQSISSR